MENLKEMLGKKLEQRRRELGFSTQESLALAVGKACKYELPIDRTRISRWESGESGVSRKYRPFLAQVLKVDTSFFDPISLIIDENTENETPMTKSELIANIVLSLPALNYDELNVVLGYISGFSRDDMPTAKPRSKTTIAE